MIRVEEVEPQRQSVPDEGVKWHEYASIFPMLDGQPYRDLVEDIRANGVREPVVFYEGQILDGRNRYCAAREAGIEYPYVEYEGDDPLAYVISLNLKRRHLSDNQRQMVGAKIAKLPKGRPSGNTANAVINPTQGHTAQLLNVSVDGIQRAKKVQEQGAPQLVAAVEAGNVSVSAAAEVAELPKEEQAEVVAKGEKEIIAQAKAIKERKKAERQAKQAENDRRRDEAREALPDAVKRREAVKQNAIAARNEMAATEELSPEDRIAELEEAARSLEAENIALKAENKKFGEMKVLWDKGGLDAILAAKDEEIRTLETRLYRESEDKASWVKAAKYWQAEAKKLGWSRDEVIDIETGEVVHG